jgi:hypothetical protein
MRARPDNPASSKLETVPYKRFMLQKKFAEASLFKLQEQNFQEEMPLPLDDQWLK